MGDAGYLSQPGTLFLEIVGTSSREYAYAVAPGPGTPATVRASISVLDADTTKRLRAVRIDELRWEPVQVQWTDASCYFLTYVKAKDAVEHYVVYGMPSEKTVLGQILSAMEAKQTIVLSKK